ncbi:hypothetical protein XENOCAPTIV_007494, partial [Xenoophorus captivus]
VTMAQQENGFVLQERDLKGIMFKQENGPTAEDSLRVSILEQGDSVVTIAQKSTSSVLGESPDSPSLKQELQSCVDTTQELQESTASPPCEVAIEVENKDRLTTFISVVIVRVLRECNFFNNQSHQNLIPYTKMLVNKAVEGLTAFEKQFSDLKWTKKVCKAVVKNLRKTFGGNRLQDHSMSLQDEAVDIAIVQSVIIHVKMFVAEMERKKDIRSSCNIVFQCFALVVGFLAVMFILLVI